MASKRGERVLQHDDVLMIRGEGMPAGRDGRYRGDLYVKFEIEMPPVAWAAGLESDVSDARPRGSELIYSQALNVSLPPRKADLSPQPAKVEVRQLERADPDKVCCRLQLGFTNAIQADPNGHSNEHEHGHGQYYDEDEDDGQPQCQQQ